MRDREDNQFSLIQETVFKDRNYCFVYDLLEKSLRKFIRERKKVDQGFLISELRQFYAQLVHGFGVSHRDLKPGNLMMDDQGNFRIIDFGSSVNILELLKSQNRGKTANFIVTRSP